jgi:hypothetical protein
MNCCAGANLKMIPQEDIALECRHVAQAPQVVGSSYNTPRNDGMDVSTVSTSLSINSGWAA